MDFAMEVLHSTTSVGERWLVLVAAMLLITGFRFYIVRRKEKYELESMRKLQMGLEIKKLLLEIELMELEIRFHASDLINIPRIQIQEDYEKAIKLVSAPKPGWPDKMLFGLLGSFVFLLSIVLFYMFSNLEALQKNPYNYVSFTKELMISIICGTGVVLIPGTHQWDYFFYGFGFPVLLLLLMAQFIG